MQNKKIITAIFCLLVLTTVAFAGCQGPSVQGDVKVDSGGLGTANNAPPTNVDQSVMTNTANIVVNDGL